MKQDMHVKMFERTRNCIRFNHKDAEKTFK